MLTMSFDAQLVKVATFFSVSAFLSLTYFDPKPGIVFTAMLKDNSPTVKEPQPHNRAIVFYTRGNLGEFPQKLFSSMHAYCAVNNDSKTPLNVIKRSSSSPTSI